MRSSAEKAGNFFQGALGGGEADALKGRVAGGADEGFEAFDGEGEVGAALGGDECVDLVDDDGFDVAKGLGGVGGEQQVERFGGGDQDLAGMAAEAGALFLGRIAGANADLRDVDRGAGLLGHVGDAGEGRAEVAFDVDRESFERGDVDDARAGMRWALTEHEFVEAPQEGGESFAGSGGGEDEGGFAAGDCGPAVTLGRRGLIEDGAKPGCRDGVKEGERVSRDRLGGCGALACGLRIGGLAWHPCG